MTNFSAGDTVRLNVPQHPLYHGKKAIIQHKRGDEWVVGVINPKTQVVQLVQVMSEQMVKVIIDPAFAKFRDETLPELAKQKPPTSDVEDDVLPDPPEEKLKAKKELPPPNVIQQAISDAYVRGFQEGYITGYQASCDDVKALMIANGLIQKKDDSK